MRTIHIQGKADTLDITEALSDSELSFSFPFDEDGSDTIKDVFFRFYESDEPCSLDAAVKGHLEKLFGSLEAVGQETGYSEYTITGLIISSLKLGGHDLAKIIKSKAGKYLHILIDVVRSD